MHDAEYYAQMRQLARQKRAEYSLATSNITLSTVRKIYKQEGIVIDRCSRPLRKLKAAYFNDTDGCSVLLNMKLPEEPRLFAMVHELKHHFVDRGLLTYVCHDVFDHSPAIEIGAEVFAAEFIFPEDECREHISRFVQAKEISPRDVVCMKYYSPARVSYAFFIKTLERLGYIKKGQFNGVQFAKLHAEVFGSRYYHRRRA